LSQSKTTSTAPAKAADRTFLNPWASLSRSVRTVDTGVTAGFQYYRQHRSVAECRQHEAEFSLGLTDRSGDYPIDGGRCGARACGGHGRWRCDRLSDRMVVVFREDGEVGQINLPIVIEVA